MGGVAGRRTGGRAGRQHAYKQEIKTGRADNAVQT